MYGSFPQGTRWSTPALPRKKALRKTIQAGELVGATVIAVGGFFDTCPKMDSEASYGPCVELLKKMGPVAADSGMTIALELSLSLAEYQKLMGLVGHPAVRPYWDATGTDHMGHPGDGTKGLEVLGNNIPMMHLKNGRAGFLMEERAPTGEASKKSGAGAGDVHQVGEEALPHPQEGRIRRLVRI